MDREEFWRQVKRGYAENYDIENMVSDEDGMPLFAKAKMHMSESGYVLTRKAKMWSANSNEFVYFYGAKDFTAGLCEQCIDFAYNDGMSKIDFENDPDHMCTRVVAIFICDNLPDEAVHSIKSCRIYKNFKMGLRGWLEVHAIGVSLGDDTVVHNKYGRETAVFFKEVLHPELRKKKKLSAVDLLKKMLN